MCTAEVLDAFQQCLACKINVQILVTTLYIQGLLDNYPNFFFYKNMVDFNEARLHEATLNLHTHA